MDFVSEYKQNIFHITHTTFEKNALALFNFQSEFNEVYRNYLNIIGVNPNKVEKVEQIPFLPIEFFKHFKVVSTNIEPVKIFESSGTTGQKTSKHYVSDLRFYECVTANIFERFFGKIDDYVVLGLLPSYLERNNSSLAQMVHFFIQQSNHEYSGFYLKEYEKLRKTLLSLKKSTKKVVLFGVSFALLDCLDISLNEKFIIIETGGMKGNRKEMVRNELHDILKRKFGVQHIYSEYGMTELLSQAYFVNGAFTTPAWLKFFIREKNDPFSLKKTGKGVLNVIDLANVESCSFIALQDIGECYDDGRFNVLGRTDVSDLRGCNLMV